MQLVLGCAAPGEYRGWELLGAVCAATHARLWSHLSHVLLWFWGTLVIFATLVASLRETFLQADLVVLLTVLYINICTGTEHPGGCWYGKAHSFHMASLINLIQTLGCDRECLSRGEVFHLSPLSQGALWFSFASQSSLW